MTERVLDAHKEIFTIFCVYNEPFPNGKDYFCFLHFVQKIRAKYYILCFFIKSAKMLLLHYAKRSGV